MAVESAADRAAFLNPDEFGVAVTYTPCDGPAVDLNGIFEDAYFRVQTEFQGGGGVASSEPIFLCRSADLPSAAAQDDLLNVNGVSYLVADLQPDGTGMTRLLLKLAEA